MSDAAVIKAAFSEWQMIKTRKVLQLRFEVPLEQGERVLRILGMPMPHEETWCAIALLRAPDNSGESPNPSGREPTKLREEVVPNKSTAGLSEVTDNAPPPANLVERRGQLSQQAKERYRNASEMQKAAWRASILCGDGQFQTWLRDSDSDPNWHQNHPNEDEGAIIWVHWAAAQMRKRLGITSRAEIGTDRAVYERFIALETQYLQDTGKMAEARE